MPKGKNSKPINARSILTLFLLVCLLSCQDLPSPKGDYLGLLKLKNITYHIYLNWRKPVPVVVNVTLKAGEFSLDTIFLKGDSVHFRLKDFYSEFAGRYDGKTNSIGGQWISEDSIHYPLLFLPVLADTVSGLHPRTSSQFQYRIPVQKGDGISTCSLGDQKINAGLMDSLTLGIMTGRFADIHSLLVARNNYLVYEEYFYRFHADFPYNIQSATKSFVSALTGIALAKGEIKTLQEKLCTYLPDYEALACNSQNKDITLFQLLTMSTGLAWDERTYDYMDERNSSAIASKEPDPFKYLLTRPRLSSSRPVFAYNSMNHSLMNAVLRNATHLENKDELKERLLEPLGIQTYYLGEPAHHVIGDIDLRPRDMLRFGLLYLNDGQWNGKQLVSAAWVRESTTTKIQLEPDLGYGYFWWTKEFTWQGKKIQSFFAWGYGGQYIFVVPEARLVMVLSGSHWSTDPRGDALVMMEQFILPAL